MSFLLWLAALLCPVIRIPAIRITKSCVLSPLIIVGAGVGVCLGSPLNTQAFDHAKDGFIHFRREMPRTIRADHPAIRPVAAAIRAISLNPLEQIVMVNDVTHLLVDYDDDERVYGRTEYQATLDEMIARRRDAGWIYLRDDCDGRAVFAAHILAALGIRWRLEASYWQQHAWIVASVGGVDYDLLQLRGESAPNRRLAYRIVGRHFVRSPNCPPYFRWRQAWRERTMSDLEIGKRLGLVELDSTSTNLRERHSTDWTKSHPEGRISPFDPRTLDATFAGFPLGDPLRAIAVAGSASPAPTIARSVHLGAASTELGRAAK